MLAADQIEARRHGIGGSDVAAVFGVSPWKTPLQLYREKRGEEKPADIGDEEAVRWGNLLEDVVAEEYARRAGVKVQRMNGLLKSAKHPWMLANIDRAVILPDAPSLVRENGGLLNTRKILEVKTAGIRAADEWGEPGTDQVPKHYLLQGAHYLAVTGAEVCDFAVLIGGQDFRVYTLERDPELVDMIVDGTRDFWRRVETGQEPEPVNAEDVRIRYRKDAGISLEATPQIAATCDNLRDAKAALKAAEDLVDELTGAVQGYMQDAATLTWRGTPLATWKTSKPRQVFDRARFDAAHPGVYEQFMRDGTASRPFLLKKG